MIRELAAKLREAADELEAAGNPTIAYDPSLTVAAAWQQLRAGLPSGDCKLELTITQWSHQATPTVEWEVWDGSNRSKASTLPAVVIMALAAVVGQDRSLREDLAEVDAALAPPVGLDGHIPVTTAPPEL